MKISLFWPRACPLSSRNFTDRPFGKLFRKATRCVLQSPVMRILLVFCLTLSLVLGGGLPTASPEQIGLSSERLNRINTIMREHVEAGRLAGASGLIARNGKVAFRETWGELKPDTIVRMYSM